MSDAGTGRPTFRLTRFFQEGYAVEDVDNFLDEVFAAIAGGRPVPNITEAVFRPTRSTGYDMAEVDHFLDDLSANLKG